ncbi:SDH family Clp fold serine proteinase [Ruegeria arenilitoris]|uniref:SDH family Clp fold serine proteinase n=1 Tax=Ruegeria arenilitoris TaxID=1173585 RepID=UPI00147CD55E|nr:S49 family peptidase [Ruegeria arenilitoris]
MPNWSQVLDELRDEEAKRANSEKSTLDIVRRRHLKALSDYSNRNVIAYYSGWLSKPYSFGMEIQDEDRNAFMMAVHQLDRTKGLDLVLHTPGGDIAAAESLVHYLRQMFGNDIRAIVPQIAMSAGTMIACSCKSIVMAKHSNLGPIDPQVAGIPAAAVKEEFEEAIRQINQDQSRLAGWQFILNKYTPTYLAKCENAVKWSKEFVERELLANMLQGQENASEIASKIVERLTDFTGNKSHSRHIHFDECQEIGLTVEYLENDTDLQDLVLTVHHCFMHSLANAPVIKIVENQKGIAFIKSAA